MKLYVICELLKVTILKKINNNVSFSAAIPNYEKANGEGAEAFAAFYKSKL